MLLFNQGRSDQHSQVHGQPGGERAPQSITITSISDKPIGTSWGRGYYQIKRVAFLVDVNCAASASATHLVVVALLTQVHGARSTNHRHSKHRQRLRVDADADARVAAQSAVKQQPSSQSSSSAAAEYIQWRRRR